MFGKNKTKWIVLGNYNHASDDYVVFVRGDKKTGLLDFKTKKVQAGAIHTNIVLPREIVDVRNQWDKIISLTKPENK